MTTTDVALEATAALLHMPRSLPVGLGWAARIFGVIIILNDLSEPVTVHDGTAGVDLFNL